MNHSTPHAIGKKYGGRGWPQEDEVSVMTLISKSVPYKFKFTCSSKFSNTRPFLTYRGGNVFVGTAGIITFVW